MRVYLLDDHALFAKSLEIAFRPMDISLTSFTKPSCLFDNIERERPDIVLLDIHIKEYTGFDVAKEIQQHVPNQKIVFLSGFDLIDYKSEAIKSGAWGLLNKNLTIEKLYDELNKIYKGINLLSNNCSVLNPLSEREKEILRHAAGGLKQQEVADVLHISRRTVNNHLVSINDKLGVNSTVSAIVQAIEFGIIRPKNY